MLARCSQAFVISGAEAFVKFCHKGAFRALFALLFFQRRRELPLSFRTMNSLTFDMASFASTQGQWWSDHRNACTERRVSLEASCMGFFLWTASFRNAQSGQIITSKVFCTKPNSEEPLALFENGDDRQRWMEAQWAKQAV